MDRGHDQQDPRRQDARDRRAAARAARDEAAEILAGALWSLICAGKGPRRSRPIPRDGAARQPIETTGV
jgi:hypothetical protein